MNPETRLPSRVQVTPVTVVISQPAISDKGRGSPRRGLCWEDGGGWRRSPGRRVVRRGTPPHPGIRGFADGRSLCPSQGGEEWRRHDPGSQLPEHSLSGSRGRALVSGEGHAQVDTRTRGSATRHGRTGCWRGRPERGVRVSQEGGVPRPLSLGDKRGDTFGFSPGAQSSERAGTRATQCHGPGNLTEDTRCPTDLDVGGEFTLSAASRSPEGGDRRPDLTQGSLLGPSELAVFALAGRAPCPCPWTRVQTLPSSRDAPRTGSGPRSVTTS